MRSEAIIGVAGDGGRFVLIAIGEDAQHWGSRAMVRSTNWRGLERRLATALTAANNA